MNSFSTRLESARKKTMKKPPLGTGERFANLKKTLESRPGVKDAGALTAWIGRKNLGKKKFQQLAAKGKRRANA